MKNAVKRTLAAVLSAVITISAAPFDELGLPQLGISGTAHAETVTGGKCGENVIWSITGDVLTISGSGEMSNYFDDEYYDWGYKSEAFSTVIIKSGVTGIGEGAFSDCKNLSSIIIPDSVKSIGGGAFNYCPGLTEIKLPASLTCIENSTFSGCYNLKRISIPDGVTSIGESVFSNCENLSEIVIPDSVTEIGSDAFGYCSNLTIVHIPDGVTSIENYTFSGCSNLSVVSIPAGVTSIGDYAFSSCDKLIDIIIPDTVTSIGEHAFSNCDELAELTIPENVKKIGSDAFSYCEKLSHIHISPNKKASDYAGKGGLPRSASSYITMTLMSDRNGHGLGCEKCGQILLQKEQHSYTCIGSNNYRCTVCGYQVLNSGTCGDNISWVLHKDGSLDIRGSGVMENYSSDKRSPWYSQSEKITTIEIANGITSIGSGAFSGCESLSYIAIPESVTSIGAEAFSGCSGLNVITIFDSIKNIGSGAFSGCDSLKHIHISPDKTYSDYAGVGDLPDSSANYYQMKMIYIDDEHGTGCDVCHTIYTHREKHVFDDDEAEEKTCTKCGYHIVRSGTCYENLKWTLDEDGRLIISGYGSMDYIDYDGDSISDMVYSVKIKNGVTSVGVHAFSCFKNLSSVDIPESVKSIGEGAFSDCQKLTDIKIPRGITSIEYGIFDGCDSLANIELPDGLTSIGDNAFAYCRSLKSIKIPDTVTSIGTGAFKGCEKLYDIEMPSGIQTIGDETFSYCEDLTSIVIPDGVTKIGKNAFFSCDSLNNVILPESLKSIGDNAFSRCDGLEILTLPASISIGSGAFSYCDDLSHIHILPGTTASDYAGRGELPDDEACYVNMKFTYDEDMHGMGCTLCKQVLAQKEKHSFTYDGPNNYLCKACGYRVFNSGVCGKDITWTLHKDGTLKITGSGTMYEYGSETMIPWYDQRELITSVVIESSIMSIGSLAFSNCPELSRIDIPDSVSKIGDKAFYNCSSLKSIVLSENLEQIGSSAFAGCDGLIHVHISAEKTYLDYTGMGGLPCSPDKYYQMKMVWVEDEHGIGCDVCQEIYSQRGGHDFGDEISEEKVCRVCGYEVVDHGQCGTNVTWLLDTNGKLIISGTGSIVNVSFFCYDSISTVIIKPGVTSIGKSAFYQCENLVSVSIPDTVTTIGDYAFDDCRNLTSIEIPDGVISIGENAFYGCNDLKSVKLPESLEKIGEDAFYFCDSLVEIELPNNLISIGNRAFGWCFNLSNINIPDSVISIGDYAFEDCAMSSINIPDSVKSIGKCAFESCRNLTDITVSDENSCFSDIDGVLFNKDHTRLIKYPNGKTAAEYEIFSSVSEIADRAFSGSGLEAIHVPEDSAYYCDIDGVLFDKACTTLVAYPNYRKGSGYTIPDGVTTILPYAFYLCFKLTSVVIPSSVTSIGNNAFANCSHLASVNIPDGVTDIGEYAFQICKSLSSVKIPGSISHISDGVFRSCDNLADVVISSGVTSIGRWAFDNCKSLVNIDIPDSVTTIGENAFYYCSSLANIKLPDSITDIDNYAFSYCESLESVSIPPNVKTMGFGVFSHCTGLKYAEIADGVKILEDDIFSYCSKLTNVSIPESVTKIERRAFYKCSQLKSIDIPNGVERIDWDIFSGCENLESITIPETVTYISYNEFEDCKKLTHIHISPNKKASDYTDRTGLPQDEECYIPIKYMFNATEHGMGCEKCGRIVSQKQAHDLSFDTNGNLKCATCGYSVSADSLVAESGCTIAGDGSTGLKLYYKISDTLYYNENVTVSFSFDGEDAGSCLVEDGYRTDDGVVCFAFDIPPAKMSDKFVVQIKFGDRLLSEREYSVMEQAKSVLSDANTTDSEAAFVRAMLNYGAQAQLYFGHNTDILANSVLTESERTLPPITAESLKAYRYAVSDNATDIDFIGEKIQLGSRVSAKFYFSGNISADICQIDGKQISPDDLCEDEQGTYIVIRNIAPEDYDRPFTVSVGGVTIRKASVFSYLYSALKENSAELSDIVYAMRAYALAAKNYITADSSGTAIDLSNNISTS